MSGIVTPIGSATQFARGFLPGLFTVNPRLILAPVNDPNTGQQYQTSDGKSIYRIFNAYVALSEDHYDEMVITEHPVEQGAVIHDHAYKLPSRLTMQIGWSPSRAGSLPINSAEVFGVSLPTFAGGFPFVIGAGSTYIKAIYQSLLDVQAAATLLTVYTGKRVYRNMLIQTLQEQTSRESENVLLVNVVFKEIIRVATRLISASGVNPDPSAQAEPLNSSPTVQRGPQNPASAPNFNPNALPADVAVQT